VSTYRTVLRIPGVASALGTSVLARIPIGALGLVMILRIRDLGGSYAAAGAVAGAFTLGNGISAPMLGRAIDRLGQTRVLVAGGAISGVTIGVLAALGRGTPLVAFLALSLVAGLALPPLGACVRVLLGDLVREPDERHTAFALEASALEIVFLIGPLAIVGGIAAASRQLALVVCGAVLIAGTLAFAASPASRRWRPEPDSGPRSLVGALRSAAVCTLLITFALEGLSFGAIEVSTAAFAQHHGSPHAVGPLLAVWGFGSLVGGIIAGRFGAGADPARRIALLLAAMGAGNVLLVLSPSVPLLAVAGFCSGLPIAPLGAQVFNLLTEVAPEGTATESTTWLATGIVAGFSAGSALGGVLIGAGGSRAGFALAAAAVAGALLAVRGSVARLRPVPVPA
jgi:MFS family permease